MRRYKAFASYSICLYSPSSDSRFSNITPGCVEGIPTFSVLTKKYTYFEVADLHSAQVELSKWLSDITTEITNLRNTDKIKGTKLISDISALQNIELEEINEEYYKRNNIINNVEKEYNNNNFKYGNKNRKYRNEYQHAKRYDTQDKAQNQTDNIVSAVKPNEEKPKELTDKNKKNRHYKHKDEVITKDKVDTDKQ